MAIGADIQFNVALGREVELYNRVDSSDPTNAAFIMLILAESGLEDSNTLRDVDTVSALLSGTTNEVTNTGYSRKTLTDADLSAYTVDDTNNWILLTLPSQTFSTISAGDTWAMVCVAYDPDTTGGTDTTLVPVTLHALRLNNAYITPSGGNIVVNFSAGWIKSRQG